MSQAPMFFRLFACCKIVKGFTRSIIYDLQRKEFHIIPSPLHDIISSYSDKSILDIKAEYDEAAHSIIDNYFQYLFDKELAFPCNYDDFTSFPDMNQNWETPCLIENFILDINRQSNHDYKKIFNLLSDLTLKVIQLRFFYEIDIINLNKIINLIRNSDIRTIEIILPFNPSISLENYEKLIEENTKITSISIYSCKEPTTQYHKQAIISQTNESISSSTECGKISKDLFTCNLNLFTESQNHNTCLNCKAAIDVNGEIKNCPSMTKSFGNYRNISLIDIIETPEFQKMWNIKKDDIEVCKDCEFRYMCTDCRVYIKDSLNIYSQPAKCAYNPYIAKWQGENDYISVEEFLKSKK